MKIDRLTPEQKARFPEFVERWTKIGLETALADRSKAEADLTVLVQQEENVARLTKKYDIKFLTPSIHDVMNVSLEIA
jgi:hypothetical protein